MNNTKPSHFAFKLSSYPNEVTVGDLQSRIGQQTVEAKTYIVDFIYHRLNRRYIEPLLHIPPTYKSGFLMMASACLLIETMQSFHDGQDETAWRDGGPSFARFFQREEKYFPGFSDSKVDFYSNIRCGILHQAETKGGYRILRDGGLLLDVKAKTIEANKFLAALKACLDNYISQLRAPGCDPALWQNAVRKVGFICDNCKS